MGQPEELHGREGCLFLWVVQDKRERVMKIRVLL
jgi:hypothetical protein